MDPGFAAPPQQRPRLVLEGVTFCCCCTTTSERVRCVNCWYASLLMVYGFVVSLFIGFLAVYSSDSLEFAVAFLPNLFIAVFVDAGTTGGFRLALLGWFLTPLLFEIGPAILMIVAISKLNKISAVFAIILLAIGSLLPPLSIIGFFKALDERKKRPGYSAEAEGMAAAFYLAPFLTFLVVFHLLQMLLRASIIAAPAATLELVKKTEELEARCQAGAPSQWQSSAAMQYGVASSQVISSPPSYIHSNALGQNMSSS